MKHSYPSEGQTVQSIVRGVDSDADKFLSWIHNGLFQSLEKGYARIARLLLTSKLKLVFVGISVNEECDEFVEGYFCL
jgi:hypothetical protein